MDNNFITAQHDQAKGVRPRAVVGVGIILSLDLHLPPVVPEYRKSDILTASSLLFKYSKNRTKQYAK